MGFVWKLPKALALAILVMSFVLVVGAVGYVVAHASDTKFMFLVAVLAVGFGGLFGGFTLGFLLGYLQESPSSRQRMANLHDEIERLKQSNKKLRVALAELAQREHEPGLGQRLEIPASPPETSRIEPPSRAEAPSLVIDVPKLFDSLRDWIHTPRLRAADSTPAALPNGSASPDSSADNRS
jgi:hypothetical protein